MSSALAELVEEIASAEENTALAAEELAELLPPEKFSTVFLLEPIVSTGEADKLVMTRKPNKPETKVETYGKARRPGDPAGLTIWIGFLVLAGLPRTEFKIVPAA